MDIKAVIFDLDGVLLDSELVNIEAINLTFDQFGYVLPEYERKNIIGNNSDDSIPHIAKGMSIPREKWKKMMEQNRKNYYNLWDKLAKPMPGSKEVLEKMKEDGKILVLATNTDNAVLNRFIQKFGFDSTFSFMITFNDITRRKPDPEIYLLAKNRLGLKDNEILVVEDSSIGVKAAKAAGLVCAAVPNEYTKDQDFSKADYNLGSIREVLSIA